MNEHPIGESVAKKFFSPLITAILTVVLFFCAQFAALIIIGLVALGAGWNEGQMSFWYESSAFAQLVFALLADSLIIGAVAWLLRTKKLSLRDIGLKKPLVSDIARALIAYGCYLILFIALTIVAKLIAPSLNLEQEQFNFDAISKDSLSLAYLFVSLVILPPLMEEILARGFLYTGLRSRLKFIPAAIITSIIFAVAHLQIGNGAPLLWVAAIDTFVLSLVLVYLRETTGRLAAPILLHGLKNGIAFSLLFLIT